MAVNVLLVNDTPERGESLSVALSTLGYQVIMTISPQDDIAGVVKRLQPDIIIIDMDTPDRDVLDAMRTVHRDAPRPVVMFAGQSDSDIIEQAIKAGVSAYVVDGLDHSRLKPVLEVAVARFREFKTLRDELDRTRASLEDRKIIEKAKGLLIKHRGLSEDQAYQALRKLAMDQNRKLIDIARSLLSAAELLGG